MHSFEANPVKADVFLLSCLDEVPQRYLHGLCFQEENLIIGNGGYQQYRADGKSDIQPGQDGTYIVVLQAGSETVIGTDAAGYYKLFLYQHGGSWALSNSLIDLARFAASKKWPVTINEPHLASFFIKSAFGNQLTSLRTSVKEIQLIPSTMEDVITLSSSGSRITLRQTRTAFEASEQNTAYGEALREYLRLWTGRMATVLQSDLYVVSDLTGGRDSRAILSLILAAAQQTGEELLQRIRFRTRNRADADLAVATELASKFHLNFRNSHPSSRSPVRMELQEGYQKWKSLCLGVYAPIYFADKRSVPTAIAFTGAGGEGHRRFYPHIAPDRFLENQRKFIPSSAHYEALRRDILDDLAFLQQGFEVSTEPMMLHYRHFRDRCHGGRTPQYLNTLSPLASASLRRASSLCSREQVERGQVLADILLNANRELALMPYDTPKKAFDDRHLAELLDASDAVRSASRNGRVYAAEATPAEGGNFQQKEALRMLRDEFLAHYDDMRKTGFFPVDYIEKARGTIEEAAQSGRFAHPIDGCAVSHVLLAGELSSLSNWTQQRSSILGRLKSIFSR